MLVVFDFDGRIDAACHGDIFPLAVGASNTKDQILLRLEGRPQAEHVEGFGPIELEGLAANSFLELQRQHTHADKVGAVNALEALRYDGSNPEQGRAFGRPIARTARSVFLPRDDHQRRATLLVNGRRVVNGYWLAGLHAGRRHKYPGHPALGSGCHQVLDPHISESASGHNAIISSPRSVAVELLEWNAIIEEVFSSWRGFLDAAGR